LHFKVSWLADSLSFSFCSFFISSIIFFFFFFSFSAVLWLIIVRIDSPSFGSLSLRHLLGMFTVTFFKTSGCRKKNTIGANIIVRNFWLVSFMGIANNSRRCQRVTTVPIIYGMEEREAKVASAVQEG